LVDANVRWSFSGGPFGSNLKASDYTEDGVRIIQLQNIGEGVFNDEYKIFTSESKADDLIANNIYPGEIIFSKMGDPVARACIVPCGAPRYVMASDGIRFKPDPKKADVYFLLNYVNCAAFRKAAESVSSGSTRMRIGLDELRMLEIPLPPLAEQRKIAEILRTWDEAIETAEAEIKAKQELHQCLLQKAFSQGACIAAGEGKLLGEVVRLVKGKKPELYNEQFKGAVPYLVARFIRGEEPPQFASLNDKNAVSVAASDIIIICDGSNSGEMFTGLDGVLSSTMAKLIPTSTDFEKAYVRYFVGYNGLRLSEAQEGGAIPHLDREKLLNFRIPMLEKKEQQLVIERLNASERAVQFVNVRTELLRTQKRGLMQKLLTGEVRVAA
jgi:type I restriction enzyme S subunit